MATCVSFTETVPRRGAGSLFAETRYEIDPSPCPLLSEVIEIQEAPLVALHEQSGVVDTVTVPVAPAAGTESIEFFVAIWHFTGDGATDVSDFEQAATNAGSRHTISASGFNAGLPNRLRTREMPGRRARVCPVTDAKAMPQREGTSVAARYLVSACAMDQVPSVFLSRKTQFRCSVRGSLLPILGT